MENLETNSREENNEEQEQEYSEIKTQTYQNRSPKEI
jgi:hypothetical protein